MQLEVKLLEYKILNGFINEFRMQTMYGGFQFQYCDWKIFSTKTKLEFHCMIFHN